MSGPNREGVQERKMRRVTKKDKSDKQAMNNRKPLEPLNGKQKEYIDAIHNNSIVICTGVWGSSKTYIPSVIACDLLLDKKIDKIIVARPTEGKGKSIGYQKGNKDEKLSGWVAPIAENIIKRIGIGNYEAFLSNGKIELLALEQVKGRSWDNTFVLVDEAEDLEPAVAKSLVGRHGQNTTTVITGDINQQDLKKASGLQTLLEVSEYCEYPVSHIDFSDWVYCVRSEEAKAWGMAFEKYEQERGKIK